MIFQERGARTKLNIYVNVREYRRGNKKGQSRETGNIGYTKRIKVREYRRGNKKGQSRETGT